MNHLERIPKKSKNNSLIRVCFVLLAVLCSTFFQTSGVIAQTKTDQLTVKGKVVDEKNEPIIGASIIVTGTTNGTVTDIDGNFSLKVTENSTISVSYIGYTTQKIKVTTNQLHIVLKEENAKLNEVVVVGYGTVKRANLTGSVANISARDVQDIATPNLASALSGTMPGVQVNEPTGNPIGSASISIRINGSFSTTSEPLYVIDGFIRDVEAFNMLDASQIESVSVLKDASASVYGVRGSNGVVLVATKKGSSGKPKINYSGSYGTNQGIEMPEMMSASEQAIALNDLWNQNIKYRGIQPSTYNLFTDAEIERLKTIDYNWLDLGWHDSYNTRHTLNVSGGSEQVKYFVGGSYMFANGNFSDLSVNKYGIRFGVEAKMTKNLTGNFSMDYSQRVTHQPLNAIDGAETDRMYGTFSELARTSRFIPPYINGIAVNSSGGIHALEMFNSGSYRNNNSNDVSAGISLEYTVEKVKGLKITLTGNYSRSSEYGKQLSVPYNLYGFFKETEFPHLYSSNQRPISDANYKRTVLNGDKIYESANFDYAYQLNPQISYNNKFGLHSISGMLVYEQSESGGNGLSLSRSTLVIPNYEVMAGYSTVGQTTSSNINSLSRRQSFIGRFNYNYADKYFIESASRYEASTMFAPGYRWGLFPSISLGWRISEEAFFKDNISFINNLKLRASAGRMGNDRASANQWRSSYAQNGSTLIGNGVLSTVLRPQNGGLIYYTSSWEKSDNYNAGLDVQFFNELSVNIDGFYKHTFDILNAPQSEFSQSAGITGTIPRLNYGAQNAWGGEIEISYNKKINKDWSIQLKGNMAYAMNKVIRKYQNPGVIGTWKDENGKVAGGEVGYISRGIARTQEDVDAYIQYLQSHMTTVTDPVVHGLKSHYVENGVEKTDFYPGMLMYEDVGSAPYRDADGQWHDGAPDGIIDDNDQRIIGKYSFAPFNYGFSVGFKWKDLKVDALFTGAFGNDVFFEKGFWTDASGGSRSGEFLSEYSNQLREWYGNYWTEENPNAKYPRLDTYGLRGYRSTFWMRDGHELRLKTINISYSLPSKIAKAINVEQLRAFVQGSNIVTLINPYPYKDASVGFWSDYPMIRTINFGLNLSL